MSANKKVVSASTKHRSKAKKEELAKVEANIKHDASQIESPPDWLDEVAVEEWNRVLPQLRDLDFVGNLDLEALAGYCNAFSNYRRCIIAMQKEEFVVVTYDQEGNKRVKENPLSNQCIKWGVEMRRFADISGMTINSRLKASQTKVNEQKVTIEDKFGDI